MVNSGVVLPADINSILNERATLWQTFDEAQSQFSEINQLSSLIVTSIPAQIPSELTDEKTPPAEVAAALRNLQAELARIAESTKGTKAHETEIRRLKNRQKVLVIIAGAIIVTTLCLVATLGTGTAYYLWNNFPF